MGLAIAIYIPSYGQRSICAACTEQLSYVFFFGIRIWPRIPESQPSWDGKGTLQAGIWLVQCWWILR